MEIIINIIVMYIMYEISKHENKRIQFEASKVREHGCILYNVYDYLNAAVMPTTIATHPEIFVQKCFENY